MDLPKGNTTDTTLAGVNCFLQCLLHTHYLTLSEQHQSIYFLPRCHFNNKLSDASIISFKSFDAFISRKTGELSLGYTREQPKQTILSTTVEKQPLGYSH